MGFENGLVRWAFNSELWRPSDEEWKRLLDAVQPEERARINRFVFKKDAKLALVGRILIRRFVCKHFNLGGKEGNRQVTLKRTKQGKPFLVICFSTIPTLAECPLSTSQKQKQGSIDLAVGHFSWR